MWLKTELLHPVDKGGKIRTYFLLKELKKVHHITYLALDEGSQDVDSLEKAAEYCDELITVSHEVSEKFSFRFYYELIKNIPSQVPYAIDKYVSREMRQKIRDIVATSAFDLIVCDFLTPAVNLPDELNIPIMLFQHNVEAMIWRRHFETASNPLRKALFKSQWKRMRKFEMSACTNVDWVVAVSKDDAETMKNEYGVASVSEVSTGVDAGYFSPSLTKSREPANLVFTGSMDWLPNHDGMTWFLDEVFPLIREGMPEISLTIVGRKPLLDLVERGKKDRSISVTGRVDDVRPYMERASVYVVPLRIGGGTRLKIFEAMAMGLPVVSTTIGAEGLKVAKEDEILIRDTPRDFAAGVLELLKDNSRAQLIGARAADSVRKKFGWNSVAIEFSSALENAVIANKKRTRLS